MALYFEERVNQQKKEVPVNDKIMFKYPWIIPIEPPPPNGEDQNRNLNFRTRFGTCYKFVYNAWNIILSSEKIQIDFSGSTKQCSDHGKGSCFVSYNLYYDNEMTCLFYSSPQFQLHKVPGGYLNVLFESRENGSLTKMVEAYNERKIAKIVIFVELHLCAKIFYSPIEEDYFFRSGGVCIPYPSDTNKDFRYKTFKDSDFVIQCSDRTVIPSRRVILNLGSTFFAEHFKKSNKPEIDVDHQSDVVKPIEIFLRTGYFEMPKTYDLVFAKRLFKAIEFFEPINNLRLAVERELCLKFIAEDHDFESILQWISLASPNSLESLGDIIIVVIADRFYFKWQQTFPENARNVENPLFLATFGSNPGMPFDYIFQCIDEIYKRAFFTTVILP